MRIVIEHGGFTSAADACRTGNQISALVCDSLAGKLDGLGGMAGDDATSAEFAASYDDGARQALDTLARLTDAFTGLGRLLTASGANHRHAEAASAAVPYSGGSLDDDDYVSVSPAAPPSCLGADAPSFGVVDAFILDHIEGFAWPGADVDLLLDAATTWRRVGASVAALEIRCDIAADFLEQQVSPEIPLALAALGELRSLVADTADALIAIGSACEEYADAVRATHDRTRDLLAEIARMVVEGAVVSAIIGGVTGGLGAGAAGSAAVARIASQAPRFHALLVALRATGTATAGRIRSAREGLDVVRTRVEKFARVPVRDERGSVRLPGAWGGARKPGWLRAHEGGPLAGHTISRHVGKTADEMLDRLELGRVSKTSTFTSEAAAERFIERAIELKAGDVRRWLAGTDDRLRITCDLGDTTGVTMHRSGDTVTATGVRVVLDRDPTAPDGWRIKTAFPD